jgi:hypothetical protein
MAQLNFDATHVDITNHYEAIPAGDYEAMVTDSQMKSTKDGSGQYLELTLEIQSGQFQGRKIWDRLNLQNRNAKAVEIAQRAPRGQGHGDAPGRHAARRQLGHHGQQVTKVRPREHRGGDHREPRGARRVDAREGARVRARDAGGVVVRGGSSVQRDVHVGEPRGGPRRGRARGREGARVGLQAHPVEPELARQGDRPGEPRVPRRIAPDEGHLVAQRARRGERAVQRDVVERVERGGSVLRAEHARVVARGEQPHGDAPRAHRGTFTGRTRSSARTSHGGSGTSSSS